MNLLESIGKLRILHVIMLGICGGLIFFTIYISNFFSYLSDSPASCINCHIMTPEYSTWYHSSHRESATCNDCHVPHENIIRKYFFKANDGLRLAAFFTLRLEPQVIQIKEAGKTAVQSNCIRCHLKLVSQLSIVGVSGKNYKHGEGNLCWDCHKEVPHGKVHSLASAPFARVPALKPDLPEWICKLFTK
jgi:cytochrome c nitrite reductase small subunit